jgi:hypothetical protein
MPQSPPPEADPLDSLLSLEDQYYTEGYTLGLSDGARSGRIEGRTFGLEKGYEKFLELGRLGGRAAVWSARLPSPSNTVSRRYVADRDVRIPPLEAKERLWKHVSRLCDLTDASTLSTENSEDAVEEFESRLKDARAKATLISKAIGEDGQLDVPADASGSVPKATGTKGLRVRSDRVKKSRGGGGEMEDFSGVLPITKSRSNRETED